MRNQLEIQERFLKEDAKSRMGHLASDLGRVASFIEMQMDAEAVKAVMEEAKFFAEWTAEGVVLEVKMLLAEIQSFLAQTELEWDFLSKNTSSREKVTRQTRVWSQELLEKAGFLDADDERS